MSDSTEQVVCCGGGLPLFTEQKVGRMVGFSAEQNWLAPACSTEQRTSVLPPP